MNNNNTEVTEPTFLHGVFLNVFEVGVLICGVSGIGKSEVALNLIDRGHHLIADDAVEIKRVDNHLIGTCPPLLRNFLEVRGLGILNIKKMYGDETILEQNNLQFIINLLNMSSTEIQDMDRTQGMHKTREICGISIPEVSIPVATGRNLSILIESAVRNETLKQNGYDAAKEFQALHHDELGKTI